MIAGLFQLSEKTYPILTKHEGLLEALQMLQVSFPDPSNMLYDEPLEFFRSVMDNSEKEVVVTSSYIRRKNEALKKVSSAFSDLKSSLSNQGKKRKRNQRQ
jgi:hypothetical protein